MSVHLPRPSPPPTREEASSLKCCFSSTPDQFIILIPDGPEKSHGIILIHTQWLQVDQSSILDQINLPPAPPQCINRTLIKSDPESVARSFSP